jgi:hypothetical protein
MIKYRYFYNETGTIVGYAKYKHVCFQSSIDNSTTYVETDNLVDIDAFRVDIESQTLVPIETE